MKNVLKRKVQGAVAFEYVIILVFMVAIVFAAWKVLTPLVQQKVKATSNMMNGAGVIGADGNVTAVENGNNINNFTTDRDGH